MRKILFQIHLWMGLILSLPFLLLGVSGALLVFDQDVIGKMNEAPALHATSGPLGSLDGIAASALRDTNGLRVAAIAAPAKDGAPAEVRLAKQGAPNGGRPGAGVTSVVSVDPVTYDVLRTDVPQNNMLMPVHFFHEDFLLGPIGRQVVGWSGVGMFFMGLSGLWLWWPRGGKWARAFTIRKNARGYVFNRDLHGAVGVWLWLVFVVVTATGAYIGLPQLRDLMGGGQPEIARRASEGAEAAAPSQPLSLDTALSAALAAAPNAAFQSISPGARATDPVRVTLNPAGWAKDAPTITVTIDAKGDVTSLRDPRNYSALESFQAWARPLHEGHGLGIIFKVLVFLSGFLPPIFVITGVAMWLQKRKNKAAARSQPKAAVAEGAG